MKTDGKDPVKFERKYKEPGKSRLLDMKKAGIKKIAPDEVAAQILDSTDYYITNYSRCIHRCQSGRYTVLKGSNVGTEDWEYEILINRWWGGRFRDVHTRVNAFALTVQAFICNYDMRFNTKIWHTSGNIMDGYYRHLYPVTEAEYNQLTELVSNGGKDDDEVIMRIVNKHHFQNGIERKWFVPTSNGHGYLGVGKRMLKTNGSNMKWNQIMVRCYNEIFRRKNPHYKKAVCGDEILNYSNFYIWYSKYEHMSEDMAWYDIDSDILREDQKIYDFEHITVLPHRINTLLCYRRSTNNGKHLIGVVFDKYAKKWRAYVSIYGKQKTLNGFNSEEEAAEGYKRYKEQFIKDITSQYEGKISKAAYDRLMNWEIDVTEVLT